MKILGLREEGTDPGISLQFNKILSYQMYIRNGCARAAYIRERASGFVREQRKSACERGDSHSRIIIIYFRATKISTFGSKITPYIPSMMILFTFYLGNSLRPFARFQSSCSNQPTPPPLKIWVVPQRSENMEIRKITSLIYSVYIYILYSIYSTSQKFGDTSHSCVQTFDWYCI